MILGEVLSELAESIESGDGGLAGEDGVTIIVAEFFAFSVEEAGVDGSLEAPGMEREREVVADQGNVVLGCGLSEEGVGVGAVRALHVFEFDDGDAGAGGGFDRGGVADGSGGRRVELSARSRDRSEG